MHFQPNMSQTKQQAAAADDWKRAADRKLAEQQQRTYTERFRIMMRLMRISTMLKNAVVTHRQIP